MSDKQSSWWTRREFLGGMAMTGAGAMLGMRPNFSLAAAEPPPETTTLRLRVWRPSCWSPVHVAEPLLREEGFTDIQYLSGPAPKAVEMFKEGICDLSPSFSATEIYALETQKHPAVFLSGLHVGCYALVGSDKVRSVKDLKGKTVWTGTVEDNGPHIFFKAIVAYVGLDPHKDVNYVWVKKDEAIQMFKDGKLDAFMSFPPGPQELMDKGVGHLLVDTNVDKPWSQYFCCMISGHKDFVKKNPIATSRAMRAILRANDIVAKDPEFALKVLMEKGIWKKKETKYVLQSITEIPYGMWRDYNPEDTIRFYAMRLHDVGMLETAPEEFIKRHTDWSYLNSLREELSLNY